MKIRASAAESIERVSTYGNTGKENTYFFIPLLFLILILSGCVKEYGMEDTENTVDENLIVVGVSQVGSESVWRTANTASIQNILTKENGYFMIFNNARQKQENQIKALRSFISQRVDYIVFSPITEDGWETVLQEAKEAGIPVILIDRKVKLSDQSLYTTWIGSDFYKEGRMAGNILDEYLTKQHRQEESIRIVVYREPRERRPRSAARTDSMKSQKPTKTG